MCPDRCSGLDVKLVLGCGRMVREGGTYFVLLLSEKTDLYALVVLDNLINFR